MPYLKHDPRGANPQYLEELARAFWCPEVLFIGVEKAWLKAGRRVSFPSATEDLRCLAFRIHKFLRAVDNVARIKVQELLDLVEEISVNSPSLAPLG